MSLATARQRGTVSVTRILAWMFPPLVAALVLAAMVLGGRGTAGGAAPTIAYAVPLAFAVAGAIIASRRPGNGIGWLLCVFSLNIPFEELVWAWTETPAPGPAATWAAWVVSWVWAPMLMSLITYLPLTFPHGRVEGVWNRSVLACGVAGVAMIVVGNALSPVLGVGDLANPLALHGHDALLATLTELGVVPVAIAALLSIGTLVRRYRRSSGAPRQQFKWFALAITVTIIGAVANGVLYETGREAAGQIAVTAGLVWLPVALGVGILRYRLYDIDRIISRTVSWALVTVVIGGMYLAIVTVLSAATATVAGESTLGVAAATLAAAAAFGPARRRIQGIVDRHFNRARYDAALAVEHYRTHLRDDLDIDSISTHLQAAITATLQPASTALWLRTPEVSP